MIVFKCFLLRDRASSKTWARHRVRISTSGLVCAQTHWCQSPPVIGSSTRCSTISSAPPASPPKPNPTEHEPKTSRKSKQSRNFFHGTQAQNELQRRNTKQSRPFAPKCFVWNPPIAMARSCPRFPAQPAFRPVKPPEWVQTGSNNPHQ